MAHYAFLDETNCVTHVIVGVDEAEPTPDGRTWEEWYGEIVGQRCLRTSYNTYGGVHHDPETNEPDGGVPFRMNYAGPGCVYDEVRDAFIPPSPFPSWVLNETTCLWEAPVPYPEGVAAYWDESTVSWMPYPEEV